MLNMALYKREMKGSIKLLVIFGAVITMYVSIIIGMYDPELMKTLDGFVDRYIKFSRETASGTDQFQTRAVKNKQHNAR